jgi:hypothetical protein
VSTAINRIGAPVDPADALAARAALFSGGLLLGWLSRLTSGGTRVRPAYDGVSGLPPGSVSFGIPESATILRERGYLVVGADPDSGLRLWRSSR